MGGGGEGGWLVVLQVLKVMICTLSFGGKWTMKMKRQIMVVVKTYQLGRGEGGSEESKGKLGNFCCCFRDLTIKIGTILKLDKKSGATV